MLQSEMDEPSFFSAAAPLALPFWSSSRCRCCCWKSGAKSSTGGGVRFDVVPVEEGQIQCRSGQVPECDCYSGTITRRRDDRALQRSEDGICEKCKIRCRDVSVRATTVRCVRGSGFGCVAGFSTRCRIQEVVVVTTGRATTNDSEYCLTKCALAHGQGSRYQE